MRLQQVQKKKQFRRILNFKPQLQTNETHEKRISQKQALRQDLQIDNDIADVAQGRHPLSFADRKLIKMLSVIDLEEEDINKFYTYDQLTLKQIIKLSAFPKATKIFMGIFYELLQLQTQIDPVTLKPINLPNGKTSISTFLTNLLDPQYRVWDKLDLVLKQYKGNQSAYETMKDRIIKPLLQYELQIIKKFNFLIDWSPFEMVFTNQRSLQMTDKKTIIAIQRNATAQRLSQITQIDYPRGQQFIQQHGRNMLFVSRSQYMESTKNKTGQHFFQDDFQEPQPRKYIMANLEQSSKIADEQFERRRRKDQIDKNKAK